MCISIPQEELEYLTLGYGDEGLFDRDLSIEDVLNGRYPANSEFVRNVLLDWNDKLGQSVFFIM